MASYSFSDPRSGVALRDMMDRLFSEAFVVPRERGASGQTPPSTQNSLTAPVNMFETATDLMVVLPIPGVSPNDIEVELMGAQLTVRTTARRDVTHAEAGSKGGDTGEGDSNRAWYAHEFQIGPYARTLELPYLVDAERVHANYEHGLLSLRFPRPEAERPRKISLQSSQTSPGSMGSPTIGSGS